MPDERKTPLPPFGLAEDVLGKSAALIPSGPDSVLRFTDAMARLSDSQQQLQPVVAELHLVTFHLDREEFAVPIERVTEIIRVGDITRVPGAPPHIRGVTNVRGRIIPVLELRTRLGLSPAELGPRSRILLAETHGRILGLLVDAVSQVRKVPVPSISAAPEEIVSAQGDYIIGVARLEPRLIMLLDLDRVLTLASEAGR